MDILSRYILQQTLGPLIVFTVVLSLIVWLSQSLQMLDLVVNQGQSAGTFLLITLYVMPSLLVVIVPFAAFCATLYALHRMSNESELVVMWSAGLGAWAVARPILIIGAATTVATLILNIYLMPAGYRAMKEKVYEIRADIASTFVRDGAFTNPEPGLTVYTRETLANGELQNLLIHDNRDASKPTTYLAETGRFVRTPAGPRLVMDNGNSQQVGTDMTVTVLYFDRYTLDLDQFGQDPGRNLRELSERYLHELFFPNMSRGWDRRNANRLIAEGHNRLASPLYGLAFVMIALTAVCLGTFSRRGHAWRIAAAMGIGLTVRLIGFGLQNLSESTPGLIWSVYFLPIGVCLICGYALFVRRLPSWPWLRGWIDALSRRPLRPA